MKMVDKDFQMLQHTKMRLPNWDPSNIVTFSPLSNNGVEKDTPVGQDYDGLGTSALTPPFELIRDLNYVWANKTIIPACLTQWIPDPHSSFGVVMKMDMIPFVTGMIIKFDNTFTFTDPLDAERIFYVETIDTTGEIILTAIIDPSLVSTQAVPLHYWA